ncbi:MAG TPA: mersacidin/lichenicidin family type 2 lantibiotic [Ktedonobacteraceae bacterium]
MKFDIVRAWKDEAYRQSLNAEQMEALPAHPSGGVELSDQALENVVGSSQSGWGIPAIGAAAASSASRTSIHSFAVICEINIYSINVRILHIDLLQIGSSHSQICIRQE